MATSYANYGGTGYRVGEPTISTTAVVGSTSGVGSLPNHVDGLTGNNSNESWFWNGSQTLRTLTYDWGTGAQIVIDEFKWYQDTASTHGTWVLEGGDDTLTSWTQIGSSFTLGGAGTPFTTTYPFTNSTAYRAYRLRQTAGSTSITPWLREIEFKIEDLTPQLNRPSFGNSLGEGDRTATITASTDLTLGASSGPISNSVDGGLANNSTDSFFFTTLTIQAVAGKFVKWDFGVGASKIVRQFRWRQNTNSSHGVWKAQGSDDDSVWTDIGTSFTLQPNSTSGSDNFECWVDLANYTTGYRYFRLLGVSGNCSATPWNKEVEFSIMDTADLVAPGSLLTFKNSMYALLGAPPVKTFKTAQYALLEYIQAARVWKTASYALMEPPPPLETYKVASYALLKRPPLRASKITQYALLSHDMIKTRKVASYALLEPRPVAALTNKTTSYALLGLPPVKSYKVASYALLQPQSGSCSAYKSTQYALLQPINFIPDGSQGFVVTN